MEEEIKIENQGTVINKADIKAKNVAFRDVNNTYINEQVSPFRELGKSSFKGKFLAPSFAQELSNRLFKNRILFISGGLDFDKNQFALFLTRLQIEKDRGLKVLELQQTPDKSDLISSIQNIENKSVFILRDLHPKEIRYNATKLIHTISELGHKVIITTEIEQEKWQLSDQQIEELWFTVPVSNIYTQNQLNEFLCEELQEYEKDSYVDKINYQPEYLLKESLSISKIAETLQSPMQISLFARYFKSHEESITGTSILELVNQMSVSKELFIHRWFYNLSRPEQVIAIGACLFDGLFDDQFFAGVAEVSKDNFWSVSNPHLEALDYFHLEFLDPFVRMEETKNGTVITSRYSHLKIQLIEAIWKSHRRHLLSVLPKMIEMVDRSLKRNERSWELFGTPDRRLLYRNVFEKTVSDIGLVDFEAIEPVLLELASTGNYYIQMVVAKAMARWRESGNEGLLFETLERWQHNARVDELINIYLARRETSVEQGSINQDSSSLVRTTALLSLAYSSDYDRPNQLIEPIIERLKIFSDDQDPSVRDRLRKVLPKIIKIHALQLKPILLEFFMIHEDLIEPISEGLSQSYVLYPKDLAGAFEQWFELCLRSYSEDNRRKKFTQRDSILTTLVRALAKIDFKSESTKGLDLSKVNVWTMQLLKQEKREGLRVEILKLLAKIQLLDLGYAFSNIALVDRNINSNERLILFAVWTSKYKEERLFDQETQHRIKVGEIDYPAWTTIKERPLTVIEDTLLKWLDSDNLIAKQYATLAFLDFAKSFEQEEILALIALKEELLAKKTTLERRSLTNAINKEISTQARDREVGLGFWLRIKIFFYLLFESKENKKTLKLVLTTLIQQKHYNQSDLRLVIYKWKLRSSGTPVKLAKWLDKLY